MKVAGGDQQMSCVWTKLPLLVMVACAPDNSIAPRFPRPAAKDKPGGRCGTPPATISFPPTFGC